MFFASKEDPGQGDRYRTVLQCARFADEHGFSSLWVPERHFTHYGSLFPSPPVLHAALARETRRLQLRAGSVVVPLHDPLRIVEEWAMVDNLSGGRIGISLAPGWSPYDFAFFPQRFAHRREELKRALPILQRLWRGERVDATDGLGKPMQVRVYPTPVQPELPLWITATKTPETFIQAGELGVNVLTSLLDHGVAEIAELIALYYQAREAAGHDPATAQVTMMLHTFVGEDLDQVKATVRGPYCEWLKSSTQLLKGLAAGRGAGAVEMTAEEVDSAANFVFERFFGSRSLMGTPEVCADLLATLQGIGVTEVACLLDFGPDDALVLEHLPHLLRLREVYAAKAAADQTLVPQAWEKAAARLAAARAAAAAPVGGAGAVAGEPLEHIRGRCPEELSGAEFYRGFNQLGGAALGERFQGIERVWRRDGEALAQVRLLDALAPEAADYSFHPAFLDACLQVFGLTLPARLAEEGDLRFLPVGFRRFVAHRPMPPRVVSHAVLYPGGEEGARSYEGDIILRDPQGHPVASIIGYRFERARAETADAPEIPLEDWYYEVEWRQRDLPAEAPPEEPPGSWWIFADRAGVGRALAERLERHGARTVLVLAGPTAADPGGELRLDPGSPRDAARILEQLSRIPGAPPCRGVVHLWGMDSTATTDTTCDSLDQDAVLGPGSALHLVQALAAQPGPRPRLWLVTRGAQPAGETAEPLAVVQSLLWGFGKTVAVERPELWGGLVDLDPASTEAEAAEELARFLLGPRQEDQAAFRGGQLRVPRLARRRLAPPAGAALDCRAGSYLVTGGLGGIGAAVARFLVERGARYLVLAGRSAASPGAGEGGTPGAPREAARAALVRDLEARGAKVHCAAVDVGDPNQFAAFLEWFRALGWPPLKGVMHVAGVPHAAPLDQLDLAALEVPLRPKVRGSWMLHQALRDEPLDFFVGFSSATQQLGLLGQGVAAYGAANAFLDALACHRRAAGQPALTLAWGPWSEVGQAAESGNMKRLAGFGMAGVTTAGGLLTLEHFLARDLPLVWAIPVDWSLLAQADPGLSSWPFLSELGEAALAPEPPEVVARRAELLRELREAPPKHRLWRLTTHIQDQIVHVMRLESRDAVDWRQGLFELGLDSLMAIEMKNRLQTTLGYPIPATVAFDYPTVDAMAAYLSEAMFPAGDEGTAAEPDRAGTEARARAVQEEVRGLGEEEMEELLAKKVAALQAP
jgi:natural product biosynthesis luciferase-like monooxygenase protein